MHQCDRDWMDEYDSSDYRIHRCRSDIIDVEVRRQMAGTSEQEAWNHVQGSRRVSKGI